MKKIILLFIGFLLIITGFSFAEDSVKVSPKVVTPKLPRNQWSLNFVYTDNGFGLNANLYKKLTSEMDLVGGLMIAGVKDPNEVELFDIFGNSYIQGKINRVYIVPVTIGIQNYLFSNTLDESLRPFIIDNMKMATIVRGSNEDFRNIFSANNPEEAWETIRKYNKCEYRNPELKL